MRRRLRKDGFNVIVLSLDWNSLSDTFRGLYPMSEKLSSIALRIRKEKGFRRTKIFLVAHSAGGLVARYYVQLLGGSHYCDGLITLGTPHSGTWVAALGLLTHLILKAGCLIHMLPISKFIKKINAVPLLEARFQASLDLSRRQIFSVREARRKFPSYSCARETSKSSN